MFTAILITLGLTAGPIVFYRLVTAVERVFAPYVDLPTLGEHYDSIRATLGEEVAR